MISSHMSRIVTKYRLQLFRNSKKYFIFDFLFRFLYYSLGIRAGILFNFEMQRVLFMTKFELK